jgi:myo-inositol-1(or 4)-monophosphatase
MTAPAFSPPRVPAGLRPIVAEGLRAARDAGEVLTRRFRTALAVRSKGPQDIVTEVDLAAQAAIVKRLSRRFPEHGILAEEGLDTAPGAEWRWILDPLDGTKNFSRGIPTFCVSIAAEQEGRVMVGIVHDPLFRETFLAVRGQGSWLNGEPIQVSRVSRLGAAFLATGVPHRVRRFSSVVARTFGKFAAQALCLRGRGAGALDLCYVACGRFDGYWELDQSPWDVAAGGLIVTEAGGRLSNFSGGPFDIFEGETVASNGRIHRQILDVIGLSHPSRKPTRRAQIPAPTSRRSR